MVFLFVEYQTKATLSNWNSRIQHIIRWHGAAPFTECVNWGERGTWNMQIKRSSKVYSVQTSAYWLDSPKNLRASIYFQDKRWEWSCQQLEAAFRTECVKWNFYLHGVININKEKIDVVVDRIQEPFGELTGYNHIVYEPDKYDAKKDDINNLIISGTSTDGGLKTSSFFAFSIADGGRSYKLERRTPRRVCGWKAFHHVPWQQSVVLIP